jgi:hypothetical protein
MANLTPLVVFLMHLDWKKNKLHIDSPLLHDEISEMGMHEVVQAAHYAHRMCTDDSKAT